MEISDRKLQILQIIIQNYLETAEPVGSRTISKLFPSTLSSATIRNEMADLEELGLIEQPHTSAGRIPSEKGYRLYVDQLMKAEDVSPDQWELVRNILNNKTMQLDSLLHELGDLLASVTSYPTIVTTPQITKARLKHLQLVPMDERSVILVAVTDGNMVRNHIIPMNRPYELDDLYRLSDVMNKELCGLTVSDINLSVLSKLKRETRMDQSMMDSFMEALNETLSNAEDVNVYTCGATNMMNFPEFSDVNKARNFIEFVGKKDTVKNLLGGPGSDKDVKIIIGAENNQEELKDCSVITASYHYQDFDLGSITIVGPVRMDYGKVIKTLNALSHNFPRLLDSGNDNEKEA